MKSATAQIIPLGRYVTSHAAMVFISGVVGVLTSAVIGGDALFAFIAGYAGGDIIENAYKTITKKPSLYDLPEIVRKK